MPAPARLGPRRRCERLRRCGRNSKTLAVGRERASAQGRRLARTSPARRLAPSWLGWCSVRARAPCWRSEPRARRASSDRARGGRRVSECKAAALAWNEKVLDNAFPAFRPLRSLAARGAASGAVLGHRAEQEGQLPQQMLRQRPAVASCPHPPPEHQRSASAAARRRPARRGAGRGAHRARPWRQGRGPPACRTASSAGGTGRTPGGKGRDVSS